MDEPIERKMFYGAKKITFIRARNLRLTMTPAEMLLWERLRNNQLSGFRFKAQHPIECFIADFYCHKARLVVEVDGEIHKEQIEYDKDRTAAIEKHDLKVIRFTNQQVENEIESVILEISQYLKAPAPPGP